MVCGELWYSNEYLSSGIIQLNTLGERLREERERLGLSQVAFGELGGVKKVAQINYEKGNRSPDSEYLAAIAASGVDVLYVITGQRQSVPDRAAPIDSSEDRLTYEPLSPDEKILLGNYRNSSAQAKAALKVTSEEFGNIGRGKRKTG